MAVDLDSLFHGAARQLVPWSQRSRRKHEPPYDRALVAAVLAGPQHVVPVDPHELRASQPYVTRAGVAYYLSGEYEATGETYADQDDAANRFPLIWLAPNGQRVILTGHHRSAAALLRGSPVWARLAGEGVAAADHRSVTAALHVGSSSPAGLASTVELAVAACRASQPVTVLDDAAASAVLGLLGTPVTFVLRAIHFSHTGSLQGGPSD